MERESIVSLCYRLSVKLDCFVTGKTLWDIPFMQSTFSVGKREHQRNENESKRKLGLYYYEYTTLINTASFWFRGLLERSLDRKGARSIELSQ